ncbi:MAG: OmpA family protein [Chitinophagaceae bacterium]|nr:OmpA family protein [Chitinophagaceae bacterium]
MKKILFFTLLMASSSVMYAQFGILDRAKQSAKNKVNNKIDEKINKGIDKTVDGVDDAASGKTKKPKSNESQPENNEQGNGNSKSSGKASSGSFKSYSKFDFVPGEKLVAAEDFSQDAVGDFPDKWNTNGSGEIVTTNNAAGKFLMTRKEVVFYPEWIKNLPDNFTLEFDLMCTEKFSFYSGGILVGFTTVSNIGKNFRNFGRFGDGRIENGGGFEIGFHPQNAGGQQGTTSFYSSNNNQEVLKNEADQDLFSEPNKILVHISLWRQKGRVRAYMNDKKVWDLPKGVADGLKLNSLYFRNDGATDDNDAYYVGNIRLAVGAPDTRNKLITEGKFVTHGILFDVNSDKIKPESYGALKDIANVLNENADVKVKIIGHTDADGDDKSNLDLSKRRAEAVKNMLSKEFSIDASRMETDGKGEASPIDVNTTLVGKANNRRVEFIKL